MILHHHQVALYRLRSYRVRMRLGPLPLVSVVLGLLCLTLVGEPPAGTAKTAFDHLFDPRQAELPARSPENTARRLLDEGHYSAAVDLLTTALPLAGHPDNVARQRWLLAEALERLQQPARAIPVLRGLAEGPHALSGRARLRLAELLLESDPTQAQAQLQRLLEGRAYSRRARQLYAAALAKNGQTQQAIAEYRTLLSAISEQLSGADVALPLADLLAAEGGLDNTDEALALLTRIARLAPGTAVAREAEAKRSALLRTLPAAVARKLDRPATVEDELARGEAFMRVHAYDAALAHFEGLARRVAGQDPEQLCDVQLQVGRALLRKRERTRAGKLMSTLAESCEDADLRAWARYYAGQAFTRTGQPLEALLQYDALSREAPGHRLQDDGMYSAALASAELGDLPGMRARLQQLLSEVPQGDMVDEALFSLAWDAREGGRLDEALRYFERLAEIPDHTLAEGLQGRARYWHGRTLEGMGRHEEALRDYEAVATNWPLSYHARLALGRLGELRPTRAEELHRYFAPGQAEPMVFAIDDRLRSEDFAAALALLQVGDVDAAGAELAHLGLTARDSSPQSLWLVAALYDAAGAYPKASALARGRLRRFLTEPPQGTALHKWRIAYPNAFEPLIEQAAAEAEVPVAYVRAVAREESAFDPRAVSSAHAYGLIQLIGSTAKQYAKPLGLPSTPAALKTPQINLRIGSHFIRDLFRRYADNPAVVPAAYNAGPGAADRWIRESPDMPLDEWVEEIPYSETRRYTRRVLQTYGVYAFLKDGQFPPLRSQLPDLAR